MIWTRSRATVDSHQPKHGLQDSGGRISGLFLVICAIVGTLTINANANAAVSGKVTDSNGLPVEGAHITFTSEPDASQHYSDVTDTDGMYHVTLGIFTAVEAESSIPVTFQLFQNYPNPFNPSTIIPYQLAQTGHVSLVVHNMLGQPIRALVDRVQSAGLHTAQWNGYDDQGNGVAAGLYLIRMETARYAQSKKAILLDGMGGRGAAFRGPHSAKPAAPSQDRLDLYSVTITGDDIEPFSRVGISVQAGATLDFQVVRLAIDESAPGESLAGPSGQTVVLQTDHWNNGNKKNEFQYYLDNGSVVKHGFFNEFDEKGKLIDQDKYYAGLCVEDCEWRRSFADGWGTSAKQTVDGGYIVTGKMLTLGVLLLKIDAAGNEQWKKYFDDWGERGNEVQQTADGGFVVTGREQNYNGFLLKVDNEGSEQWRSTFEDAEGHSVQQMTDGGFIVAGREIMNRQSSTLLVKIDSQGLQQWRKVFGDGIGLAVRQGIDGGFLVTGAEGSYATGIEVLLLKTDEQGIEQWRRKLGHASGGSVQQTKDGGIMVVGSGEGAQILLLKTDDQGVKQWEKTLGRGTAGGGQQTLDGGFAITGSNNYDEVVLLKTDVQGNEEWRKTFGFEGYGNSIQQTADGGCIFTGSIQKSWDGFIFKTDSRGDIDLDLDELGLLPIMSD